ncbi:hypothetical protein C8R44DRAFT_865023 [Mycena epipterygia]|nr:hypothetical protein C8R44DRAFT_865023 [Mycena epipterygia]
MAVHPHLQALAQAIPSAPQAIPSLRVPGEPMELRAAVRLQARDVAAADRDIGAIFASSAVRLSSFVPSTAIIAVIPHLPAQGRHRPRTLGLRYSTSTPQPACGGARPSASFLSPATSINPPSTPTLCPSLTTLFSSPPHRRALGRQLRGSDLDSSFITLSPHAHSIPAPTVLLLHALKADVRPVLVVSPRPPSSPDVLFKSTASCSC